MGTKFSQRKKAELCLYQNSLATITSRTRDKRDSASFKVLLFHKTTKIMVQIRVYFCLASNGTLKLTDIQFPSLPGFIYKEINEGNTDPATASVEPVLPEQRSSLSLNFVFD